MILVPSAHQTCLIHSDATISGWSSHCISPAPAEDGPYEQHKHILRNSKDGLINCHELFLQSSLYSWTVDNIK